MFNTLKKRIKNEKGLSLVELLAVIVILAIVAAIAIPAIGNIVENSRYNGVKADAVNVLSGAQIYFTDNPEKADVTITALKTGGYLENAGSFEKNASTITITKATAGNKIVSATIEFSGTKKAVFTNATIPLINGDKQKGSAITDSWTVGNTVTNP
ncbi:prepilin-type N-terminal cleavage/methylation domain-containing protein [Solibacillus merdavium]|uniref:Prepilin-type N-terminal cleavage/methylation domain-containing protein n=1 Tax=Solibacillus merdavium TaxID=2762218 RepID=A0ABR8XRH4_9BACL|nr:prepilin-type N-terminal cleavage/methylation domain-containing protein [Solibacillus merdavium]MBD8034545.1 prepilin-type N-terminal cleavage/methylation domain-containing protein [Solibacillus merdavium]